MKLYEREETVKILSREPVSSSNVNLVSQWEQCSASASPFSAGRPRL